MPLQYLEGKDGSKLKVLESGGFCVPTFYPTQEQELLTLPDWRSRDNDLLICAYPKSGTHWLWEVVCMLFRQKAERIAALKESTMIEVLKQADFDSLASPRILSTHIYFRHLPNKILLYEYSGSWEPYLQRYLKGNLDYGSWFDYTLDWEKIMKDHPEYPIHTLCYEDMKQDSKNEILRLAKFLELDASEDLIRDIDDLCSFEKMKREKNKLEDSIEWKDKEPGMYRKGQVGDWKNWFTVAQSDMFDNFYKDKMKTSKVKVKFAI